MNQIPEGRRAAYYIGGGMMVVGFLLFISNFFFVASGPPSGVSLFDYNPMPGLVARGLGGMLLMIAGGFVRSVGARGAAGSGLVLDPQQAREDLKPWAQTAGGLVKDALEQVQAVPVAEPETVVKVRCPKCRELNDEDAAFCKRCGAPM
ncbi:MAG TPA: zinc ribbon domain-containing protein [Symbiobacteriaceae bacterium]|nr:zinc ribbon domain-containing protein [Symbiobacteriaceae bacterium]